MLALIIDFSTRQMIGEVADSIEKNSFTLVKNPLLVGEVNQNGRVDIAMQPLFQTFLVPEINVSVSSYFKIESDSPLTLMYEKVLSIHKANMAGIVTPNQRNDGKVLTLR